MIVELKITYNNGKVTIQGPMQDKMFVYGMLEMAKQLVVEYKPSGIQEVPPGFDPKKLIKGS